LQSKGQASEEVCTFLFGTLACCTLVSRPQLCTFCRLAEDLFLLNKAALLARKERMRERLQQDTASVQNELATKGLAIAINID